MSRENASRRGRSFPKGIPAWVITELRQEALARGDEPPAIKGKHSSEMRGKQRMDAEAHEKRLREESAVERVRRVAAANRMRRRR